MNKLQKESIENTMKDVLEEEIGKFPNIFIESCMHNIYNKNRKRIISWLPRSFSNSFFHIGHDQKTNQNRSCLMDFPGGNN
jgi:hypothetical protein